MSHHCIGYPCYICYPLYSPFGGQQTYVDMNAGQMLTDNDVERIARRVVENLTDKEGEVIRDAAQSIR